MPFRTDESRKVGFKLVWLLEGSNRAHVTIGSNENNGTCGANSVLCLSAISYATLNVGVINEDPAQLPISNVERE